MLKYKQLFIGILIGAFVFSVVPVSASIEKFVLTKLQYKIIVNGVEYKDDTQPALNYKGTTYVPLRSVGKLLGQEPRWNEDKNQVEIGESINNIDLNTWVNIDTLIRQYTVNVTVSDDTLVLEKNDKKYSMPRFNMSTKDIQILTDTTNNTSFSCLLYKNRIYLKIDELKKAGILN